MAATKIDFCFLFSTIMVCFIVYRSEGISIEDHRKLHQNLLSESYDPLLRPANDTSRPVEVGFRFTPTISILNEVTQELALRGMLKLSWQDFRLQWDPSEHHEIRETEIPIKRSGELSIWAPELVLNESLETDFGSFQPESHLARLNSTGFVQWYTWAGTKSFCLIDVRNYPFDQQTCILTFTTWVYQIDKQVFVAIDDIIVNQTYKEYQVNQGVWDAHILNVESGNISYGCESCVEDAQSFVRYSILLTRKQKAAYFSSLILPCLVMSAMNILVIFLPQGEDANTATFGLTCVLTLIVFLTFLFTILPSTGQPLLGYYVVCLTVESVLITVYAVCDAHHSSSENKSHDEENSTKNDTEDETSFSGSDGKSNEKTRERQEVEEHNSAHGTYFVENETLRYLITFIFWPNRKPTWLNVMRCAVIGLKVLSTFTFALVFIIVYNSR